jgi:cell division septation protein DedD
MQADSMRQLVDAQVLALTTAPESTKDNLKIAIRDNDAQAVALQKKADEWFAQAIALENAEAIAGGTASVKKSEVVSEVSAGNAALPSVSEPVFAILTQSPYSAANPIPLDEPLPDGVAYKIQLGAFSKPLPANAFKGLTPLSGEKLANGVVKYYAGLFRRFANADDALRKVRQHGFKDAYIVAFYNRKTIQVERAKQLEL